VYPFRFLVSCRNEEPGENIVLPLAGVVVRFVVETVGELCLSPGKLIDKPDAEGIIGYGVWA